MSRPSGVASRHCPKDNQHVQMVQPRFIMTVANSEKGLWDRVEARGGSGSGFTGCSTERRETDVTTWLAGERE